MRVIADLHIHSKYARACSQDLNPSNLATWAVKKGITVLGSGDFTHPKWLEELEESLEQSKPGLYCLRGKDLSPYFLLTAEVASIYKQGDKVRRIHNLIFAPSLEVARKLNQKLTEHGANLKADGRPIMGIKCDELMKLSKDVDPQIEIIPAHAWTPHFGVFGSLSGFSSLAEAFGDQTRHIFAIETGLSSDPAMNWQVEGIDNISLISNSDAHSLRKLGREANVFELTENQLSYQNIIATIRNKDPKQFLSTVEFFPEEGKYHLDGHRDHSFSCTPEETKRLGGICPQCGKKLLLGVLHRVDDLADRPAGFKDPKRVPYVNTIPLEEIIAETYGVGTASKKVAETYEAMVKQFPEFEILLDLTEGDLVSLGYPIIARSIMRVRQGQVHIKAGYDGVFGKIQIYSPEEREQLSLKPKQTALF